MKTVTTLTFKFSLPRDLYANELLYYRLGIDLESANSGNERILMTIYDEDDEIMDVEFT